MKDLKARKTNLINGLNVIDTPELVKIQTIKKKYLEQIPDYAIPSGQTFYNDDDIVFFGICGWMILYARNGKLERIHEMGFTRAYAKDFDISIKDAWEKTYSLPVIFKD